MTCHYPDLVSAVIDWKIASTNQKHYPDLGSDTSSVWNFCARSSDVISWGNQWWVASRNVGCFHRLIIIFISFFFFQAIHQQLQEALEEQESLKVQIAEYARQVARVEELLAEKVSLLTLYARALAI